MIRTHSIGFNQDAPHARLPNGLAAAAALDQGGAANEDKKQSWFQDSPHACLPNGLAAAAALDQGGAANEDNKQS
eukprot:1158881-Pelagomonas_calceolata.AAC.2